MRTTFKAALGGVLLASAVAASGTADAMPVHPLAPAAVASHGVEHVWWRGGYGFRGRALGWRRPFYGYRVARPFVPYRFGYAYGWRRPFFAYGYGRPWGFHGVRRFY